MYQLITLFSCLAVAVSNPEPSQVHGNWPWVTKPDQSATPSYWPSSGSALPNSGGEVDSRGEGWGLGSSSSSWGSGPGSWGSSGDRGWGSSECGGTIRRSRCAPSVYEIERQLIGAAQKMTGFCTAYSDRPLREIYGVEHYKLRVRLAEFSVDDIQVRVRQRLVTVLARSCAAEYAAVRILPDVVDAHRAVWKMDGDTLTVLFPYNVTPDSEIQSRCGREFHGDPIIVPKCDPDVVFVRDYDMYFTDANLMQAIKRALQELARDNDQYYS